MGIRNAVIAICLFASQLATCQAVSTEITNSDVINMTKAGIGEKTIVLTIQRGPVKFDTSPQALIALKGAGVSDQVLNAVLASANVSGPTIQEKQEDAQALFQKALDAIGPHDKLMAIHAVRSDASVTENNHGNLIQFERNTIRVYPDSLYIGLKLQSGALNRQVITPDFNYRAEGTSVSAIPAGELELAREGMEFDTIYIAQHLDDYTVTAMNENPRDGSDVRSLKINRLGISFIWVVDGHTGRLLSITQPSPSGDVVTDYSDWRLVDGVYFSFKRHQTKSGIFNDSTVAEYVVNPDIDSSVFQRPSQTLSQVLTLKVLEEKSVPYTQESGGGISTSCSIVGSTNTSGYVNTYGNSAYGNATTSSNQHMSCNSYDTTIRWPHILNVMFAEGSDGNSYIVACDRAWRWSKCVPLRAGDVFQSHFTQKGIEVVARSTNGKEENLTYQILQSKSLR